MDDRRPETRTDWTRPSIPGTGALCPEAQADGFPCETLGVDCETCGRSTTADRRLAQCSERVAFSPPVHRA